MPAHEGKSLLRFLTCGSVDDGKSTLIGRLLHDTKRLFEDQLTTLKSDSKKCGTTGGEIDFALLVDGLVAEREQGITIDVAYRYFATDRRRFIVADTPGHEQYTRNMATGASNADLAVLLVDARAGILAQTRRHAYIVSLLGIRHVVLAVNKIDLVGFERRRFQDIVSDFAEFAAPFNFAERHADPDLGPLRRQRHRAEPEHALVCRAVAARHLETVEVANADAAGRSAFPSNGSTGRITASAAMPARSPAAASSRATTWSWRAPARRREVARIVTIDGDLARADAGAAVTLTLDSEIDLSRGDVLSRPGSGRRSPTRSPRISSG